MRKRQIKKIYKTAYSAQEKLNALKLLKVSTFEFTAHRYHCTIQTLYRWKRIYDGTIESLEPKYCAPHTPHPNSHTSEEIKNIKNVIKRNPNIGLNELYGKLRLNYAYVRNPVSLYRFLRKNGWYKDVKKKNKYVPQHYDTPVSIGVKWQLDVKYVPRSCYVGPFQADRHFYQYTVIDEATRERFIYPYEEQIGLSTVDFIKRAIIYYGYKPDIIQTDNGSEFTYTKLKNEKEHIFDRYCLANKIIHKTIKPRTPRHNGKVERSHRNDNERFYKYLKFYSYEDLKLQMKAYLNRSNSIPISTLKSRDGKLSWLTPKEKRKELLLLDWGVVE
ncbi:MAG: transposase [Clostridia bacterium]|nr:transposase [Clostridia bacterium]